MMRHIRLAAYQASVHHAAGESIPVALFETLCGAGVSPGRLFAEFNEDAGQCVPLFPLLTKE